MHLKGLFATRKLALSTMLIWLSWLLIGLAYPLYNVFLPTYLATRGASFGSSSPYLTWRNYAIANVVSIPGPIVAGYMCKSRFFWGRRGTMVSLDSSLVLKTRRRRWLKFEPTDYRRPPDNGVLLCLHPSSHCGSKHCLHLLHRFLSQHLLRHPLRLYPGSSSLGSQRDRQRDCNWVEQDYGDHQCGHCNRGKYKFQRAYLHLCRALHPNGCGGGRISFRTNGTKEFVMSAFQFSERSAGDGDIRE